MDPQACLQRIIDIYEETKSLSYASQGFTELQTSLEEAFEDLWDWLRKGGFPPKAKGPIFGQGPRRVGYPGMSRESPPKMVMTNITLLRSSIGSYLLAIMVVDPNDKACQAWQMQEDTPDGDVVRTWLFPTE